MNELKKETSNSEAFKKDQSSLGESRVKANRLIHESSPYLLQHAHNPVDWFAWGNDAFAKAKEEDKPILVSIGYAACHWCHVMEKESFENEEVAALMNEHFVNIKVDREERPDVDHIYMDAVQAISGGGGWPLNVFLTPDRKPFYGGTYFPPKRAFNRASWPEVLLSISDAYKNKKHEIEHQAETLTAHLRSSNAMGHSKTDHSFGMNEIGAAFKNVMKTADGDWGGFGKAPKFPQTFTINFLLTYGHLQNNTEATEQALLSLDKMLQGGIYDHIGGGFARYSTDAEWLVPHFEKMLYDNALLVSSLADAYQLTGNTRYKETIVETLEFIERELMHEQGGFFSALDADSEGVEGKFYVWEKDEVIDILKDDAEIFCNYFNITPTGNWEGKNIPRTKKLLEEFAEENKFLEADVRRIIKKGKEILLQKRAERIRPQLDDKVLLSWNALMNSAYSKAYAATGDEHYKNTAVRNMQFLLSAFGKDNDKLHHTWKAGKATQPAFLEDYSYLISALIQLSQITADFAYLRQAEALTNQVLTFYTDDESLHFYFTHKDQEDILLRKKEIYDGATPSGNSVMADNLFRLAILLDQPGWRQRAENMVHSMGAIAVKYPTSFGVWLSLLYEMIQGTSEIAIVGKEYKNHLKEILSIFIPHRIIMASEKPFADYPLLAEKPENSENHIFLCKNYACKKPVNTKEEFITLLSQK